MVKYFGLIRTSIGIIYILLVLCFAYFINLLMSTKILKLSKLVSLFQNHFCFFPFLLVIVNYLKKRALIFNTIVPLQIIFALLNIFYMCVCVQIFCLLLPPGEKYLKWPFSMTWYTGHRSRSIYSAPPPHLSQAHYCAPSLSLLFDFWSSFGTSLCLPNSQVHAHDSSFTLWMSLESSVMVMVPQLLAPSFRHHLGTSSPSLSPHPLTRLIYIHSPPR